MMPNPSEQARAKIRELRERRYRSAPRPAREITIRTEARRHRGVD